MRTQTLTQADANGQWLLDSRDLPQYTVDDWQHWKGQWELISGVPYSMLPLPTKIHQRLCLKLADQFLDALDGCNDCEVHLPVNYRIDQSNLLHPDLLVVCEDPEPDDIYLDKTPSLVVEVLSSNKHKDRVVKKRIYAAQGIKYFVTIDQDPRTVEVYELIKGKYKLVFEDIKDSFIFEFGMCSAEIDFSKIW